MLSNLKGMQKTIAQPNWIQFWSGQF